jgi:hypothetical protein
MPSLIEEARRIGRRSGDQFTFIYPTEGLMRRARACLVVFLSVATTLLATACGSDVTTQPGDSARRLAPSPIGSFSRDDYPSAAVFYTTVTFTISPYSDTYVQIGPHFLDIPANSVCDPATSGYGVGTWTLSCRTITQPLRVTATATMVNGHPQVNFGTHLRFRPGNDNRYIVTLYLRDDKAALTSKITWCPDGGTVCVDETSTSLSPGQIQTRYDMKGGFVYRRIEHFSGYNVTAGDGGDGSGSGIGQ